MIVQGLPIGNEQFQIVREKNYYYDDKTLMIKEFLDLQDTAALITRPRRFGKTLNMTMLREFFDITKDSHSIFEGLKIMDTPCAVQLNSKPVLYFSFKDCAVTTSTDMLDKISREVFKEYARYYMEFHQHLDSNNPYTVIFYRTYEQLRDHTVSVNDLAASIEILIYIIFHYYHVAPILLIDEYDQPILSSYEHHYHEELKDFFASLYGSALKSNQYIDCALLTGIQRVAKESIFSKLNNIQVYTVLDKAYSGYFGLTASETEMLLQTYNLVLNQQVKEMYDGYTFGGVDIYNPWSILMYAKRKNLENYWINTSTNFLIRQALETATSSFMNRFEKLIEVGSVRVGINLETSFLELKDEYTLWGLLINSGYLKVMTLEYIPTPIATVAIPNKEVSSEFQSLVAEYTHISDQSLTVMFSYLTNGNIEEFFNIYKEIVLNCTSYYDAKENAYHMLFLGMCISLRGVYMVSSNIESGHGRSDITLKSFNDKHPNVIIEFKQGDDIAKLKEDALNQILDLKYYASLTGKTICVGLAHNKKQCDIAYTILDI